MNKGIPPSAAIGLAVDELTVFANGMCITGFLWTSDLVHSMGFLVKHN